MRSVSRMIIYLKINSQHVFFFSLDNLKNPITNDPTGNTRVILILPRAYSARNRFSLLSVYKLNYRRCTVRIPPPTAPAPIAGTSAKNYLSPVPPTRSGGAPVRTILWDPRALVRRCNQGNGCSQCLRRLPYPTEFVKSVHTTDIGRYNIRYSKKQFISNTKSSHSLHHCRVLLTASSETRLPKPS